MPNIQLSKVGVYSRRISVLRRRISTEEYTYIETTIIFFFLCMHNNSTRLFVQVYYLEVFLDLVHPGELLMIKKYQIQTCNKHNNFSVICLMTVNAQYLKDLFNLAFLLHHTIFPSKIINLYTLFPLQIF